MTLLADGGFPATIESLVPLSSPISRATAPLSDADLISHAANNGFRAVVLLGRTIIARPELRDLAKSMQVCVVTTTSTNPMTAMMNVVDHIRQIDASLQVDRLVNVTAGGVEVQDFPGGDAVPAQTGRTKLPT